MTHYFMLTILVANIFKFLFITFCLFTALKIDLTLNVNCMLNYKQQAYKTTW